MPKYLGQHFLKNTAVIKKIITAADIQPDETIVEVGPGHGELTIPLAAAAQKLGAKIFTIEKDKKLFDALGPKLAEANVSDIVESINADILLFFKTGESAKIARPPFKVVGNIPYYLTGHLLRLLGELESKPGRAIFMIQEEVAERICTEPPRMNRLAASVQFWATAKIIARVPRSDFSPPPEVESAVIELIAKAPEANRGSAGLSEAQYYRAMRAIFAQPRKTVLNNVAEGSVLSKDEIATALSAMGIDPKSRPQDLSIEKISQIAQNFFA